MWLLVYFLNEDRFLEEILEEFIETGVPGGTILDGTGMLHYLSEEVPIFAGFRSIVKGTMPTNKVLPKNPSHRKFPLFPELAWSLYVIFGLVPICQPSFRAYWREYSSVPLSVSRVASS